PCLGPFRVVGLRSLAARRADGLAGALKDLPETTRLLITVSGRLGAGSALLKAAAAIESGIAREFVRLKGRTLSDWASNRARELGLPPSVAAMVQRASPADLGIIDSELRKLAAYHEAGFPLARDALLAPPAGGPRARDLP